MDYFPNDEELSLLKFIAKYQYLKSSDVSYFFNTKRYYQARITRLTNAHYIIRNKGYLTLDKKGIKLIKGFNFEYTKKNRNKDYQKRLAYISHIAAFYNNTNNFTFTPSYLMKSKEAHTNTSRKFMGTFEIKGFDYLVYHISSENDKRYITSVLGDIQKEKNYKNIIIITNNINKLNIYDFTFGYNSVLLIEDTDDNLEHLKYIHNVNWPKIVHDNFTHTSLSEYSFCDYTDHRKKFISTFYFLDTEKINKINISLRENRNKDFYIICTNTLKNELQKYLPNVTYKIIELENYIEKQQNIYN